MSQENVQVVMNLYAAFARRDFSAITELLAPDFEAVQSTELPWGGHFKGPDGLRRFFEGLMRNLNNTGLPIERTLDAGDHVVAIGRTQGTVLATGKTFDVPLAHVWEVHGGKAVGFRPFIDHPTMMASLMK